MAEEADGPGGATAEGDRPVQLVPDAPAMELACMAASDPKLASVL